MSRILLLLMVQLLPVSCGTEYAGISRARAVEAAKAHVVRVDYRGDEPLFYRNTGDRPAAVLRSRDAGGHRVWFVRFDDFQAMRKSCVTVRRSANRVIVTGAAC